MEKEVWRLAGGHIWDRCRRACDTAARVAAAAGKTVPRDGQRSGRRSGGRGRCRQSWWSARRRGKSG
jgi:hypothetical protein